jgi:hypothetical protein
MTWRACRLQERVLDYMHASEEEQKQAGRATNMSKTKRKRTVTLENLLKGLEQLKAFQW